MKRLNRYIRFVYQSSKEELMTSLQLFYLLSTAYILVNIVPLKYYYNKFLFSSNIIEVDLQPFQYDLSMLSKIQQYFPVRITCIMHALAMQSYLKMHGINVPIKLGLNTSGEMSAHAWIEKNQFQNEFKILTL
jgi:hypothetical protein